MKNKPKPTIYKLRMGGEYIKLWTADERLLRLTEHIFDHAPWYLITDLGHGYVAKAPNLYWVVAL